MTELAWLLVTAAGLAALGDVALPFAARVLVQRYTFLNPHSAWLTPVPWLVVVLPVVALVALAGHWFPRHRDQALVTTVMFAMVLEPLLVLRERIAWYAVVVVALGVAVQLARAYRALRHPLRVLRVVAGLAATGIALIGGGWAMVLRRHEARALEALGSPAPDGPNLLLIVLDTVRAMELGMFGGGPEVSPWLDGFAATGVRFDRAWSPSSWTLPSHASLFTGHAPFETTADWHTPLDGTLPTVAERLAARGYATAGFSANLRYVSRVFGLSRGFAHFEDFASGASEAVRGCNLCSHAALGVNLIAGTYFDPGRKHADALAADALQWLGGRPAGRPWFVFMNFYDAHAPYDPPSPFDTKFATGPIRHREPGPPLPATDPVMRETREAYRGAIASLDQRLGVFMDSLRRRGLLEHTVVIITSDHGEQFGEHSLSGHGTSLYGTLTHVPLVVAGPGIAPRVVDEPVAVADLAATLLTAADGGAPARDLPGVPLQWAWSGAGVPTAQPPILQQVSFFAGLAPHVPTSRGDLQAVISNGWQLHRRADGYEELYDIRHDPEAREDRYAAPGADTVLNRMHEALVTAARKSPRRLPPPTRRP